MDIREYIDIKKKGKNFSKNDIKYLIKHLVDGNIQEAQLGALLMAICLRGLSTEETQYLTYEMAHSGKTMEWPREWKGKVVDKHSTGGVGDTVSLILAPALAALGLKVPMVSGKSLGYCGGTLDKLSSIPGFRIELSLEEVTRCLEEVGCCIVGQSQQVNPADRVLYNRRDLTNTVEEPGLITASIISKKGVENLDALIMDVKFGRGAYIKNKEEAIALAKSMINASKLFNTKVSALLTRMDNPIGRMIGNALEVREAVESLKGRCPADLKELVTHLGGYLLWSVKKVENAEQGAKLVAETLQDGSALRKFQEMIQAQGVEEDSAKLLCDKSKIEESFTILPTAPLITTLRYDGMPGFISSCAAEVLGYEAFNLGNHLGVGYNLIKVPGDKIQEGDPWLEIHHTSPLTDTVKNSLRRALTVSETPPDNPLKRIQLAILQ